MRHAIWQEPAWHGKSATEKHRVGLDPQAGARPAEPRPMLFCSSEHYNYKEKAGNHVKKWHLV
jgi:hypothetical protein